MALLQALGGQIHKLGMHRRRAAPPPRATAPWAEPERRQAMHGCGGAPGQAWQRAAEPGDTACSAGHTTPPEHPGTGAATLGAVSSLAVAWAPAAAQPPPAVCVPRAPCGATGRGSDACAGVSEGLPLPQTCGAASATVGAGARQPGAARRVCLSPSLRRWRSLPAAAAPAPSAAPLDCSCSNSLATLAGPPR